MGFLIFVWISGLVLCPVGVYRLYKTKGESFTGFVSWVFGVFFLLFTTFVAIPFELRSGMPPTSIDAGEYKVAFIYVAGENVTVGVNKTDNKNEYLYVYQFPKSAFDNGSINTQAKKLVVVGSGRFRKLVLE